MQIDLKVLHKSPLSQIEQEKICGKKKVSLSCSMMHLDRFFFSLNYADTIEKI